MSDLRAMVERLAARSPYRTHDSEWDRCTFCGAAVEYRTPRPERDRMHLYGCLWADAQAWLSHHPSPERETSGHEQQVRSSRRR